jgi:ComF family protein
MKEVLHRIKFDGRRDLVRIFVPEISSFCKRRPQLASYDCLVPIPLDPRRRLEREFNQSGLLAERVSETLGIRLERRGILKRRSTSPQCILGREARKLNLEHAFRIPDSSRIRGRSILLVDDIFTTGATVEEAAKTLKTAGASRVCYLALARAWSN